MQSFNIAFAGAGNVASALSKTLYDKGHSITRIVSPGKENGKRAALLCNAEWSDQLIFSENTDIIIVAVPDRILEEVLSSVRCGKNSIVVHTAGSFGIDVFPGSISRKGVFYPLQTFTKGREVNFPEIPLLIEAGDMETESVLKSLGESLGCTVYVSDAESRRLLHVAAVFVSNFTNYMLTSGKIVAAKTGFSFDLLKPLIIETVNKAIEDDPVASQTGPAIRNDINTIEKHMKLLSFNPELQKVYRQITDSIIYYYKQSGDE
jgi:predicted short-subunit dehydrogenase-like oxidoreductase (DUF2520 family)